MGDRLAYALREAVRASDAFTLTVREVLRVEIYLTTLDYAAQMGHSMQKRYGGEATIYAVVWTMKTPQGDASYLNSTVGTCGVKKLTSCAEGMVATMDVIVRRLFEAVADRSRR